jgi:hypothetical protein
MSMFSKKSYKGIRIGGKSLRRLMIGLNFPKDHGYEDIENIFHSITLTLVGIAS